MWTCSASPPCLACPTSDRKELAQRLRCQGHARWVFPLSARHSSSAWVQLSHGPITISRFPRPGKYHGDLLGGTSYFLPPHKSHGNSSVSCSKLVGHQLCPPKEQGLICLLPNKPAAFLRFLGHLSSFHRSSFGYSRHSSPRRLKAIATATKGTVILRTELVCSQGVSWWQLPEKHVRWTEPLTKCINNR